MVLVKKRYIVLMIFVCLFAISTVSANEMMNETDSLRIDESNDLMAYETNDESNNLGVSTEISSCTELSQNISYTNDSGIYQLRNDFNDSTEEILKDYNDNIHVSQIETLYFDNQYDIVKSNSYVNIYLSGDNNEILNIEMKKAFTGTITVKYATYDYLTKRTLKYEQNGETHYIYSKDGKQTIEYYLKYYEPGHLTFTVTETLSPYDNKPVAQTDVYLTKGITAPNVNKYYKSNENFVVKVFDDENKPISNETVYILINGNMYTKKTNSLGIASIGLNLNPGKYNITTIQGKNTLFSKVIIKSTITANDLNKIYKNGTQYYATFKDSQGNLLKNTDVKFNINGVFYTRTTNNQGTAKMNINLNPGTYILTAENPVNGEKHSNKITVLSNIVENYDLTKYYKSASQFTFRLLNDNGKPVGDGVSATININGVFYTRISDASGYVKMNINLNPGTYIATIQYNGLMMSNTVKVLSILKGHDISMKYRDGTKYEVQLLDSQGNPYSGEDVTFNINGVFYKRTTDDNGIARLNINLMADTYIITSEYNGLMMSNTIIVDPNPLYYTIGSNPLNYGYYMNKYNKFSLDWYYNPQWDAMVKTIYDIYGNQGMEIRDQDVRNDIKYHCYEASTGRQYILNSAGEVLPFY